MPRPPKAHTPSQTTHTPKNLPPADPAQIGHSGIYLIKKYGLYRYQTFRVDPVTGDEKKIGEPNIYGVVASDLVDLMFKDINPEHK